MVLLIILLITLRSAFPLGEEEGGSEQKYDPSEMSDEEWQQLKAEDLVNNLDKVPDLSKLNQQELSKAINQQYGVELDIKNLPAGTKIENDILKIEDSTINLEELKGEHTIEAKNGKLYIDDGEFKRAENVKSTDDGQGIEVDFVEAYNDGIVKIFNGVNVKIYENYITAEHADSFVRDGSVSTNIDNLKFDFKIL